jgi:HEPN domain-containing protein
MNEPRELRERAQRWLSWAVEDLAMAETLAANPQLAPRGACMWAHQAAEKALKALLIDRDVDPPKLHYLVRLNVMVGSAAGVPAEQLDELSRWALEGRYPADLAEATTADMVAAIDIARRVVAATSVLLASDVGE